MSSEMLSRFMLSFNDPDLKEIYKREKVEFFNNQVVIVDESILDELLDRVIKPIRNLLLLVTVFQS